MVAPAALMALKAGISGVGALAGRRRGKAKRAPTGGRVKRRRTRLTASQLRELTAIKSILGKTAAANALPFYFSR